jgi:hypothetical protein
MELSLGGIVRQVTAPVLDAASLARTGGVDQIASFLRDNPDQRGTIETVLAASGRTGDLSAIVERAGSTLGQAVDVARQAVGTAGTAAASTVPNPASTVASVTSPIPNIVSGAINVAAATVDAAARAAGGAANGVGSAAAAEAWARPAQAIADAAGRVPIDAGRTAQAPLAADGRAILQRGPDFASAAVLTARTAGTAEAVFATRTGETLATALRDGRLAQLITVGAQEGRLAELVAEARATGRLPELAAAARTLDGVLATFAAKGGLSATELALFARAGLLSEADTQALRAAGIPVDTDVEGPALQGAPRDGPGEERFDSDTVPAEGVAAAGVPDPALAHFDAGAIRIASRAAVETYGLLGPPGGLIVPADAFEGLLRAADGDLAQVERRLGLEARALTDPDTLVAFVERADLRGLRLPTDAQGAGAWLPGGDKAGGVGHGLADLGRGVPFREVRFR